MSDGRPTSVFPRLEEAPVSSRGKDSREFLTRFLERQEDRDFVPGTPTASSAADRGSQEDLSTLADSVAYFAETEPSALAQARGLAAVSVLSRQLGDGERARQTIRDATERAPKLASISSDFRSLFAEPEDPEFWQKHLESAARLATHPASKNHAALLLAESLLARSESQRALALLDHTQRTGAFDSRISLLRVVLRLAQGQSALAIEPPHGLETALARTAEILGGRGPAEPAPHLELLRASRELRRGDAVAAAEALLRRGEHDSSLLAAELLSRQPEQQERADQLRRDLALSHPTPLSVRAAALASSATGNWEALAALTSNEATGQHLSPEERRLLDWLRGAEGPDDATQPESADLPLVFAPLLHSNVGLAPATAARLRLGARLPDVASASDDGVGRDLEHGDELAALLLELEDKRARGDGSGLAEALARWPDAGDGPAVLGALVLEARGLAGSSGHLHLLARPGLVLLQNPALGGEAESAAEQAERVRNPELGAELRLEAALRGPRADQVRALLDAADSWGEPGFSWLAATLAETIAGDGAAAARALALDHLMDRGDPLLSRLARCLRALAQTRTNPALAAEEFERLALELPGDVGLARASELCRQGPPSQSSERLARPSAWYAAERAAFELLESSGHRVGSALGELLNLRTDGLGNSVLDRWSEGALGLARQSERYLGWLRSEDSAAQLHAYARLAELDAARGDTASAFLWRTSAVEARPDSVSAWLRLEDSLLFEGRVLEWPQTRDKLARLLAPGDRDGHALVGAAMALGNLDLRDARLKLDPLLTDGAGPLLAQRLSFSRALEQGDDEAVARISLHLASSSGSDLDRATLLLEAAYAEARQGRTDVARSHAEQALACRGDLFATHLLLCHLQKQDSAVEQAEGLERLAAHSHVTVHQAIWLLDAASSYQADGDEPRARGVWERVLEIAPDNEAAFEALSESYLEAGELEPLSRLVQARLAVARQPSERLELELRLAELSLELERPNDARSALERALSISPKQLRALRAHALVCQDLGDLRAAERTLVVLLEVLDEGREKAAIYRTLGSIYDESLGDLERAMDAYEAALERLPGDRDIERRLVGVFTRLGLGERASTLQTKLIQSATTEDEKRRGALLLAELYENLIGDPQRASATWERALKAWPLDADVFERGAAFLERRGDAAARAILIDRVKKDSERTLLQGRLEAGPFDTFSRAARLSGVPGQAEAAWAARAAFIGEDATLAGAGVRALEPVLDEMLAPPLLSAPLLRLLRRTGPVLDTAFPLDLAALGAARVQEGPSWERLGALSRELGRNPPELFVAAALGSRCQPLTSNPPRFIMGPGLDDLAPGARDYQLFRALKFQELGAGALARSRPEDAWSMLAALLILFAPNWRPHGGDARKVAQARALVEQGLARVGYDDDVPTLVLEAIGALGDRGETVGEALRTFGMRVALVAVGLPAEALAAISAGTDKPLPEAGPARFRWFEGHPEAKDLLHFALGDDFTRVREKLGLAQARTQRAPLPPRAMSLGPVPPRRS